MTTNTIQLRADSRSALSRDPSESGRGWLDGARRVLAAFRRMHQRRRAIAELTRMSDWRLADLGIPRDQIREVVDGLMAREGPSGC